MGATPPKLADVAITVRVRDNNSRVVVRRVAPDGAQEVWLVNVTGRVRRDNAEEPEILQGWAVDGRRGGGDAGGRRSGHADRGRSACGRRGHVAAPAGRRRALCSLGPTDALLCLEAAQGGINLTTYQVLG